MARAGVFAAAPGPQIQELIAVPIAGGVQAPKVVCVAALHGASRMVPPAPPEAVLFIFAVATEMTASPIPGVACNPVVVTVETNFVPEPAVVCSHPNALAATVVPEEAD